MVSRVSPGQLTRVKGHNEGQTFFGNTVVCLVIEDNKKKKRSWSLKLSCGKAAHSHRCVGSLRFVNRFQAAGLPKYRNLSHDLTWSLEGQAGQGQTFRRRVRV